MRYRKLSESGDYQFGHSGGDFWRDVPDAVGQAVKTRLWLFRGEWFADTGDGTPWGGFPLSDLVVAQGQILGEWADQMRDLEIKRRILGTEGVQSLIDYSSAYDAAARRLSISARISTIYGATSVAVTL